MSIERNNLLAKAAKTSYPGWWSLIEPLVDEVNSKNLEIQQIKEKFGMLRFYFAPHDDALSNKVAKAESASSKVCSDCSSVSPRAKSQSGWVPSVCQSCYDARREHCK